MANVQITQLSAAQPLDGNELVPIVQNGVTVKTTTGAIAASPVLTAEFVLVNYDPTVPNSRYLSASDGVSLTDNGALSTYTIGLDGAVSDLNTVSTGILVKDSSTTLASRTVVAGSTGVTVANGNGISGNPSISLDGYPLSLSQLVGTGLLSAQGSGVVSPVAVTGTAGQIDVANGNGIGGNPTISLPTTGVTAGSYIFTSLTVDSYGRITSASSNASGAGATGTWDISVSGNAATSNVATNLAGGAANRIAYQTSSGTTGFIVAPTTANYNLQWNGSAFSWVAAGTASIASNLSGGSVGVIPYQSAPDTTAFLSANSSLTPSFVTSTGDGTNPLAPTLTSSTGSGNVVLATSPTLATPNLGTPTAVTLTNATGLPLTTGVTGTLAVGNGGTGATTLTGYVKGTGTTAMTASATIPTSDLSGTISNAQLANSSVTLGTTSVSLGATTLTLGGLTSVAVTQNPTTALQLATKQYVDTLVSSGVTYHTPVKYEVPNTTGNLTATYANGGTNINIIDIANGSDLTFFGTAPAVGDQLLTSTGNGLVAGTEYWVVAEVGAARQISLTYGGAVLTGLTNGSVTIPSRYNDGVGATLTNAGTQTAFTPDGVVATAGDRILIYNQTNAFENGVYEVTTVGSGSTNWVLTRTTDADTYGLKDPNQLGNGDAFFVSDGDTGAGETYVVNTAGAIFFGVTNITFAQISAAQVYNAGTGLTLSPATTFNIANTGVTAATYGSASSVPGIAINAQGQITSATNTAIAINGNQITSGTVGSSYISGSYTGITGVGTLTAGTWNANTIGVAYGGTNITSYTSGDMIYASGTTTLSKLGIGTDGQILTISGGIPTWGAAPASGVTTFSAGTTGFTPSTATSGAVTLSGTLNVSNGGTGAVSLTGILLGNGTSAFSAATASDIVSAIGSTAVTNATNAANIAIATASSNADYYMTFVSTTTGNLPLYVDAGVTYNPSTNAITSGIQGGTF